SPDQSSLSSSPEHFAAGHVLPRLLAPRHPPFALPVLTKISPLGPARIAPDAPVHAQDAVGLGLGKIFGCQRPLESAARTPDRPARGRPAHEGRSNRNAEDLVELIGIEPTTSGLQSPRSPS